MRLVIAVAVQDSRFLLVYNPKRKGWEFPGGVVEEDETDREACVREFREEVGFDFIPTHEIKTMQFTLYIGKMGKNIGKGEMKWSFFEELPENMAFPRAEYITILKEIRNLKKENPLMKF
ncbi:MAG: NUDIX hydrolase [Methanomassiliicoccales archaeon]